jgi:hypothetical protein
VTNGLGATTTYTILNAVSVNSGAVAGQPAITSIKVFGGSVTLSGTNIPTAAGHIYYLLSGTNVAAPRSNWLARATNTFAPDGGFTNTVSASGAQQFFLLSVPTP